MEGIRRSEASIDHCLVGDVQNGQHDAAARYSPSPIAQVITKICDGRPDPRHISTSYIERQNLTMRMAIRRFHSAYQCILKEAGQFEGCLGIALCILQLFVGYIVP